MRVYFISKQEAAFHLSGLIIYLGFHVAARLSARRSEWSTTELPSVAIMRVCVRVAARFRKGQALRRLSLCPADYSSFMFNFNDRSLCVSVITNYYDFEFGLRNAREQARKRAAAEQVTGGSQNTCSRGGIQLISFAYRNGNRSKERRFALYRNVELSKMWPSVGSETAINSRDNFIIVYDGFSTYFAFRTCHSSPEVRAEAFSQEFNDPSIEHRKALQQFRRELFR